jgi:hypothetical protein
VDEVSALPARNYPLNCWYVAATGDEICPRMVTRRLLGQQVLLFRPGSGRDGGPLRAPVAAAVARPAGQQPRHLRVPRSLLTAGVDTTVNGISSALYCAASFPNQWQLVRDSHIAFAALQPMRGTAHMINKVKERGDTRGPDSVGASATAITAIGTISTTITRPVARWAPAPRLNGRSRRGCATPGQGADQTLRHDLRGRASSRTT